MEGMKWINVDRKKVIEDEGKMDIKRSGECAIKHHPFMHI